MNASSEVTPPWHRRQSALAVTAREDQPGARETIEFLTSGYRSPIPSALQWRAWAADPEGITGDALLAFVNNELFPGLKALTVSDAPGDPPPRRARRLEGAYTT